MAALAALLLVGWTGWFLLARVTLYETSMLARLEATAAAHPVDARMLGRVVSVNLTVGRIVHSGDILVELEADAERLALGEARRKVEALGPQIAAVRQEVVAEEQAVEADRRASLSARDEQRATLREAEAALGIATEEARQLARLRSEGVISEIENARARADVERRKATVDAAAAAIARIESDETTRESDRRVRIQRLRGTLSLLEGELATTGAAAKRFEYEVERRVLRAPIDGRIAEAADLRIGAVVDEADRLAAIVPDSPLRVVAQFAPAAAIGRVRVGQPARVRILGFPWAEYGSLQARVTAVADELRDGLVRVELGVGALPANLPLSHALPGSVEIEVERVRPAWLVLRSLGGLLTRPIANTPPAVPRPTTSADPHDPRPVTLGDPRNPRPVAVSDPRNPRPVAGSDPRDPRPVAVSDPRNPRPVAGSNPRPVTASDPRSVSSAIRDRN
jgi:membrane fusion protein (multidrug efflux system)